MESMVLEALRIVKTPRTPEVVLDPKSGNYSIVGRSIPEDSVGFYQQITRWLDRYSHTARPETTLSLRVELEYFNTSSSKCLLDVFKRINRLYVTGFPAEIVWVYDVDDEDQEEMGEDFGELLELPFRLEGVEY